MASMKGSRPKSGGKGKVRRMVIEPAQNGFMSTTEHHPSSGAKGMEMYSGHETKAVHPSISHLAKHVKTTFGQPGGQPMEGEEPDQDDMPQA
jgi:hypothetical protein